MGNSDTIYDMEKFHVNKESGYKDKTYAELQRAIFQYTDEIVQAREDFIDDYVEEKLFQEFASETPESKGEIQDYEKNYARYEAYQNQATEDLANLLHKNYPDEYTKIQKNLKQLEKIGELLYQKLSPSKAIHYYSLLSLLFQINNGIEIGNQLVKPEHKILPFLVSDTSDVFAVVEKSRDDAIEIFSESPIKMSSDFFIVKKNDTLCATRISSDISEKLLTAEKLIREEHEELFLDNGRSVSVKTTTDVRERNKEVQKILHEVKEKSVPISARMIGFYEDISQEELEQAISYVRRADIFLMQKLHFKFEEITLKEQILLLQYIDVTDKKKFDHLQKIALQQKNPRLFYKTFLSVEQGGADMGDAITLLAEKLSPESAGVLFTAYEQIVNSSEEVAFIMQQQLGEKVDMEMIQKIQEKLLFKGKALLLDYAEKIKNNPASIDVFSSELQERLALAQSSSYAFAEVCKLLVERNEFNFENFKDLEIAYDRSPLPEQMISEIETMHYENTKQYPQGLQKYWRDTLHSGLRQPNPQQLVISVKYQNAVVSVMRVIEQSDGSWYGASFNVNPTVQGSRVGTELLKKVLHDMAQEKPFVADCYEKNPMLDVYLRDFGFKITDTYENYHETGAVVYQITYQNQNAKENQRSVS